MGGAATGGTGTGGTAPIATGCGLDTPFAGDENCIPAPAENDGFQLHIGPADYDDPDDVWVLQPTDEATECFHMNTPNTEKIFYFKQQYRMRPGSHHMIISVSTPDQTPGWGRCETSIIGAIGGTQHTIEDFPVDGKIAPEDEDLGRSVAPATPLSIQLHFFNATEEPTLREVWVNYLYKDEDEVKTNLGMLGGFAPVSVPPHTSDSTEAVCDVADAVLPAGQTSQRVVALFGHAHAHNTRFAVFWEKADGSAELVYDNYEWEESPQFFYNSVVQNPVPDPIARKTGAYSGILELQQGDRLRFQCDITNDLNTTLRETNEVFTGEMCNLFGSVAGLGFPCFGL